MSKKNSIPIRTDPRFTDEIKDMQLERQKIFPKEKLKPKSPRRLTKAISRHNLFPKIKQDIIEADLV